jgi:hypothetical protein
MHWEELSMRLDIEGTFSLSDKERGEWMVLELLSSHGGVPVSESWVTEQPGLMDDGSRERFRASLQGLRDEEYFEETEEPSLFAKWRDR